MDWCRSFFPPLWAVVFSDIQENSPQKKTNKKAIMIGCHQFIYTHAKQWIWIWSHAKYKFIWENVSCHTIRFEIFVLKREKTSQTATQNWLYQKPYYHNTSYVVNVFGCLSIQMKRNKKKLKFQKKNRLLWVHDECHVCLLNKTSPKSSSQSTRPTDQMTKIKCKRKYWMAHQQQQQQIQLLSAVCVYLFSWPIHI